MLHLDDEDLVGYAEGRLDEDESQFVKMHTETCGPCAVKLRNWLELFDVLKSPPLEDAPHSAIRSSIAIYNIPEPATVMREILAGIVFNSFDSPLAAGVRGMSHFQQILFRADDIDIHLQVSCEQPVVLGQLMERSKHQFVSGARVGILQDGKTIETTVSNPLGEFRFSEVPQGDVQLHADLPSHLRVIARFKMPA